MCMYIYLSLHIYIYIYREREGETYIIVLSRAERGRRAFTASLGCSEKGS